VLLTKLLLTNTTLPKFTFTLHSCGAYTLKYMLAWYEDKKNENFTQIRETIDLICAHEFTTP
jgi:hypothetical protein